MHEYKRSGFEAMRTVECAYKIMDTGLWICISVNRNMDVCTHAIVRHALCSVLIAQR